MVIAVREWWQVGNFIKIFNMEKIAGDLHKTHSSICLSWPLHSCLPSAKFLTEDKDKESFTCMGLNLTHCSFGKQLSVDSISGVQNSKDVGR